MLDRIASHIDEISSAERGLTPLYQMPLAAMLVDQGKAHLGAAAELFERSYNELVRAGRAREADDAKQARLLLAIVLGEEVTE